MKVLQFTEYMERFADASLAMCEAIRELTPEGGRLEIQPGCYEFYPDLAYEHFYCISNNDKGGKRIAMPFIDAKHITVEGNGATFLFHGKMMPIILDHSEDICIRNLSIDFARPFYTEGVVVESVSPQDVILNINATRFPYYIRYDRIHFTGFGWDTSRIMNIMQYSPETGNLVPETADCHLDEYGYIATQMADGHVHLHLQDRVFPYSIQPGNVLVIVHATRENPGIFGVESQNLRFEGVTVHHSEGMSFIFQLCREVSLQSCRVVPSGSRLVSACADATHFVNCSGNLTLKDCLFESQCDDATNVHGIYTCIRKMIGNRLYVQLMHYQQEGVPLYHPGDHLRLLKCNDLMTYGECRVTAVEQLNTQILCIQVDQLPEGIEVGDGVENFGHMPETVTISGCTTGKNRARSFLISCHGKVRIFENDLHSNGAAIWISGDCNYWYESGPVDDVEIYNNRIECLNDQLVAWGTAAVEVVPELIRQTPYYHGRIAIHHNEFHKKKRPIVHALCVRDLRVTHNRQICAEKEAGELRTELCQVTDEGNVMIL